MKAAHMFLSGNVQGVFFRSFAKMHATKLGIRGYVRNLPDGRVEVWVEAGDDNRLFEIIKKLKKGPEGTKVTHSILEWKKPKRYTSFEIVR